jgi:hypothetical protein
MSSNEMIELNVGGQVFATTIETLRTSHRDEEHFFRSLVIKLENDTIPVAKDSKNRVFIDRNPTYFNYILDYIRDGTIQGGLSAKELHGIMQEAIFYSLNSLCWLITKELDKMKPPMLLWGYAKYRVASYDGLCLSATLSGCEEFRTLFRQHKLYEHQVLQIAEQNDWKLVTMCAIKSTAYQHVVRMAFKKHSIQLDRNLLTEDNAESNDERTVLEHDTEELI